MKKPDIRSTLRDEEHNMTYHVVAYRKLNELEMIETIKMYMAQPKVCGASHLNETRPLQPMPCWGANWSLLSASSTVFTIPMAATNGKKSFPGGTVGIPLSHAR